MTHTRRRSLRPLLLASCALLAAGVELFSASDAHAIIGRPLTPMSFAGVARRTTRRAAYGGGVYGGGVYGGGVYGGGVYGGGVYGGGPAVSPYYW